MFPFYTHWEHQERFGFLMFSGVVERQHWLNKLILEKLKLKPNSFLNYPANFTIKFKKTNE